MCVYSLIGDHYWDKTAPWREPSTYPRIFPPIVPLPPYIPIYKPPSIEEFRRLIKEMEELLVKAKKYDEENNQKECDLKEKKDRIRKLCEELGVEVNFP
jgi:hypothetical protein